MNAERARKLSKMDKSYIGWYKSIMKEIEERSSNGINYYNAGVTDPDVISLLEDDGYFVNNGTITW